MSNHNRSSSEQRMVGRRKLEPRADCKRCPVRSGVGGKLVESTAARRAQSEEREAKRAEIPPISAKLHLAVERINAIAEEHKPIAVFGLFSGGNDSLAAIYATSLAKGFSGAVHVNTGIGVEETRNFVRRTCAERGWKLLEYKALENRRADGTPDPMDYEAMCLAHGFPGPAAHQVMYVKLKERQLARLERDMSATPSRPLLYVTGARSDESKRRMGNVEPFRRDGRRLWLNAIHDWSSADCAGLRLYAGLKQNEASSPTESA